MYIQQYIVKKLKNVYMPFSEATYKWAIYKYIFNPFSKKKTAGIRA